MTTTSTAELGASTGHTRERPCPLCGTTARESLVRYEREPRHVWTPGTHRAPNGDACDGESEIASVLDHP